MNDNHPSARSGGCCFTHQVNEQIKLTQLRGGLTFGTDAYLLAASVKGQPSARAVDLGSGTGIIPLLCLARSKAASFTAVEVQPAFCELIAANARGNGMSDRLIPLCRDVRALTAADVGGEVSLVTANPPYMKAGSGAGNRTDEKTLARHEVCGGIADFCAAAGRILRDGGRFFVVFRPERLADLLGGLRSARLEPKRLIFVQATAAARPSMLICEAVKGASPSLLVTPPLCLWEPDPARPDKPDRRMIPSSDAAYIYDRCALPEPYLGQNRSRTSDVPRGQTEHTDSEG